MNQPQRRRLYQRIWFWLLVVCLIPVLILGSLWMATARDFERRLADIRAQGLPTTASEINEYYHVPQTLPDTTEEWLAAVKAIEVLDTMDTTRRDALPIVGTSEVPIPRRGESWEQLDASRQLLVDVEPQLRIIRLATAGGVARFPVDFAVGYTVLLNHVQSSRQIVRLLQLDAWVSLHDGDFDRAFDDVNGVFATSNMLLAEPIFISQLVRIALHSVGCQLVVDMLPQTEWNDSQLVILQKSVAVADFKNGLSRALIGERAMSQTAMESLPMIGFRRANQVRSMELFEKAIVAMDGNWTEALKATVAIRDEVKGLHTRTIARIVNMGVIMWFPALDAGVQAGARATARQRCVIIALAAQRFFLQHDRYPENLEELSELMPAGQPDATTDPFDNAPLRFQSTDSGLLIYSVGENQIDDGGSIEIEQPGNVQQDIGVLLSRINDQ